MNLFSRTRRELVLGLWAAAPVIGSGVLFVTWQHRLNQGAEHLARLESPVAAWMPLELIAVIALAMIAAGVMLNDLARRPLPAGLRRVWKVLLVLGMPFGGLAYWLIHCHGDTAARPA